MNKFVRYIFSLMCIFTMIFLNSSAMANSITLDKENQYLSNATDCVIHFISVGQADATLIEYNGHFGLVDSGKPTKEYYTKYIENSTDETILAAKKLMDEKNNFESLCAPKSYVLNYLDSVMKDKHLDFVILTHAHCDSSGSIPDIANSNYVTSNTKYYYRPYRASIQDTGTNKQYWYNEMFAKIALEQMQKAGAQCIDITTLEDSAKSFSLGNTTISLCNVFNYYVEDVDEDFYAMPVLIEANNKKVLLCSDLRADMLKTVVDQVGKVNIITAPHHGDVTMSSTDILDVLEPAYVVISTSEQYKDAYLPQLAYLKAKDILKGYFSTANNSNSAVVITLTKDDIEYTNNNTKETTSIDKYIAENQVIENGWKKVGVYTLYYQDGNFLTGMQDITDNNVTNTYFFDEYGRMVTGWRKIEVNGEQNWYYFNCYGQMIKNTLRKIDYNGKTCVFYFNQNGIMQTGFQTVNITGKNNVYYFNEQGVMLCGWQKIDDAWYYFDETSGVMVTGMQKLEYNGATNTYYFGTDGKMKTSWNQIWINSQLDWYYFDGTGAMVKGWQYLTYRGADYWYYFDEDGKMLTGWHKLEYNGEESWYYFEPEIGNTRGSMYRNVTCMIDHKEYTFDSSGKLIYTGLYTTFEDGKKVTHYYSENEQQYGWQKVYNYWYYFDENGNMVKGFNDLEWNGETNTYYFNSEGKMVTSWNLIYVDDVQHWYYFNASGAMLTGWQYLTYNGTDNWYYFEENGQMLTGMHSLKWENATYTYYFEEQKGALYGAMYRNRVATINGNLYYFDKSGARHDYKDEDNRGWIYEDGNWYYYDLKTGLPAYGWQYLTYNGKDNWYYFMPDKTMLTGLHEVYYNGVKSLYYFEEASGDTKGAMYRSTTATINGTTYVFDSSGKATVKK